MKFALPSAVNAAAALLLSLSAIPIHSLPINPASSVALEKHTIEGLNNYNCKLTPVHPRPVILLHGATLTVYSWSTFAPELIKRGYCVFGLTYGKNKKIPGFGGLTPVEDSAREIGAFADEVMRKMNVSQVDIVGHSQGGILTRYWIKYLDGAGKVYRHIGIAPIHHGTTLNGIATLTTALGLFYPFRSVYEPLIPSLSQLLANSTFMQTLNAGGDTSPGVIESNIATKYEDIITPWKSCFQHGPGVINAALQDLCTLSLDEHLDILHSKVALQFVLNQLDPSTAKTASCLSLL
ncbi:hypothetical protein BX616_001545 [Lobosporangium transversale]|uniref:Secreted lipase n=1 Tax=Lobosporangium transversale TaxID=64571 RepID=A0A1Y2GG42_9FUNG|nr:secreted lipase [Lobosporangium transversale]KAF9903762.1 hypothetical protein BX616_001545 [Lobosporangium transversale]ORZ09979.1 secreted lipase [Lobosporangium transversale]|eukprot:XP_021879069.1 secreted lipase [Lobosporangium transversale]